MIGVVKEVGELSSITSKATSKVVRISSPPVLVHVSQKLIVHDRLDLLSMSTSGSSFEKSTVYTRHVYSLRSFGDFLLSQKKEEALLHKL